jgi:hypothetical protein
VQRPDAADKRQQRTGLAESKGSEWWCESEKELHVGGSTEDGGWEAEGRAGQQLQQPAGLLLMLLPAAREPDALPAETLGRASTAA